MPFLAAVRRPLVIVAHCGASGGEAAAFNLVAFCRNLITYITTFAAIAAIGRNLNKTTINWALPPPFFSSTLEKSSDPRFNYISSSLGSIGDPVSWYPGLQHAGGLPPPRVCGMGLQACASPPPPSPSSSSPSSSQPPPSSPERPSTPHRSSAAAVGSKVLGAAKGFAGKGLGVAKSFAGKGLGAAKEFGGKELSTAKRFAGKGLGAAKKFLR
ncbi:hypothetical protein DFJ73DRAFT_780120 [Zopfochytrium polystomum]|nr:hypothetical protein DFJ73DRAFT_780120 [Zopfochytrium polystomum]